MFGSSHPPPPGLRRLCASVDLRVPALADQWNPAMQSLLCLAAFRQRDVFEILPCRLGCLKSNKNRDGKHQAVLQAFSIY